MSSETTNKFILDATAGHRMMWFNKHHPNTIYVDEKPECEPDYVTDYRNLKEFEDERFRLIVFDPPHLVRKTVTNNQIMISKFGQLNPETWQSDIKKAFTELWRVLKPYGVLIFKWNNSSIKSNELLKLAPTDPLFYQIGASNPRKYKNGGQSNRKSDQVKTLWFCFMKIPEGKI